MYYNIHKTDKSEIVRLIAFWALLNFLLVGVIIYEFLDLVGLDIPLSFVVSIAAILILMMVLESSTSFLSPPNINCKSHIPRSLIVGANPVGYSLEYKLCQSGFHDLEVLGYFDEQFCGNYPLFKRTKPLLGALCDLPTYVKENHIDIVYIAIPPGELMNISLIIKQLKDTTACVYLVTPSNITAIKNTPIYDIGGIYILPLWEIPYSRLESFLKQCIDTLIAVTGLIILLPLLLIIAFGVKVSSAGPIFFKQKRYGINAHEITIYKFRTMSVMEDGGSVIQAKRNDSRVTPIGALLRRSSLDELPQLLNVLKGEMSIVGPRPHALKHNEEYRQLIDGYMLRHKLKPGITGWAQIHGFRGETDTLDKMEKRVEYDLYYLRNWSLGLDISIIFRTIFCLFGDKNAY